MSTPSSGPGSFLDPGHDNVLALLSRQLEGPVVMLNLLRFRDVADYSSAPELAPSKPVSGREAYDAYIAHTLPFLEASGGSLEFLGDGGGWFIGPAEERWDLAMMIRQASVEAFFAFADDPGYLAGLGHRTAAVEDSRLLPLVARSATP